MADGTVPHLIFFRVEAINFDLFPTLPSSQHRQNVFEFIGITDITFVHAENLAMGAEERQDSIAAVHEAIDRVIATWTAYKSYRTAKLDNNH